MFITDRRATRRADTLERLRRLPVALTVPLALLILPGFIILTLGPTVASIVKQLLGGLL
jgi:pilus assembly protein TadC